MRISDWSSDVCSSDLPREPRVARREHGGESRASGPAGVKQAAFIEFPHLPMEYPQPRGGRLRNRSPSRGSSMVSHPGVPYKNRDMTVTPTPPPAALDRRSVVFARLRFFAEAAIGLALLGADRKSTSLNSS